MCRKMHRESHVPCFVRFDRGLLRKLQYQFLGILCQLHGKEKEKRFIRFFITLINPNRKPNSFSKRCIYHCYIMFLNHYQCMLSFHTESYLQSG
jgi:hypothetical protein